MLPPSTSTSISELRKMYFRTELRGKDQGARLLGHILDPVIADSSTLVTSLRQGHYVPLNRARI